MSPRENKCRPRWSRGWHWFSRGDNVPCNPLLHSIIIILYSNWMLIEYIVYITFCFDTIQVLREYLSLYFVLLKVNAHTTSVRIYGEPYAHKFCTVDFFPSSSNITRSQVQSRVSAWFHDSVGDIDFNQLYLSQSKSTILHESIILNFITCMIYETQLVWNVYMSTCFYLND